jgi:predicted ATP-dependent serine protease
MLGSGLREVSNPKYWFHKDEELSGTAIASTLEGMRPLMIEIQALVSTAVYGRRNAVLQDIMQKTEYDSSCSWKERI